MNRFVCGDYLTQRWHCSGRYASNCGEAGSPAGVRFRAIVSVDRAAGVGRLEPVADATPSTDPSR